MKTKEEIEHAIETMRELGRNSTSTKEKQILMEKMGALTWVLKASHNIECKNNEK